MLPYSPMRCRLWKKNLPNGVGHLCLERALTGLKESWRID